MSKPCLASVHPWAACASPVAAIAAPPRLLGAPCPRLSATDLVRREAERERDELERATQVLRYAREGLALAGARVHHGVADRCVMSLDRPLLHQPAPRRAGPQILRPSHPVFPKQALRAALAEAETGGCAAEQELAAALANAQQQLAVERQRGEMLQV